MAELEGLLLTGGTGLLGRHLLVDLLAAGHPVAVLARDTSRCDAHDRIREAIEFASCSLQRPLSQPTLIRGDLRDAGLGLSAVDRAWMSRRCRSVIHAAACVSFRATAQGEPALTNTIGTANLLALCDQVGIKNFHHVSTAFGCGARSGVVPESAWPDSPCFHNEYERSKHAAERLVKARSSVLATIYRPSSIVGDSATGYTSTFHGFYRFIELADRLAELQVGGEKRSLPLRLPFTGDEPRDLVPVDWVSRAIARIVGEPALHGCTYHLTAGRTVPVRLLKSAAERELAIEGVTLAGLDAFDRPSTLERAFLDGIREYWPYRDGDPAFDRGNVIRALPDLPAPVLDENMLSRLVRFAVRRQFGRGRERTGMGRDASNRTDCSAYIEKFFPDAVSRSSLASVSIRVAVGLSIAGPGGGRWVCRFGDGRVLDVSRSTTQPAEIEYRMDAATFAGIIAGRETPQEAFFSRRVAIAGDIEKGLKLAVLFGRFATEFPDRSVSPREARHAVLA